MALYHKYRPKNLNGFCGNENTVNSLKGMHEEGNIPHALLFTGKSGCGKTTLGRILKNMLGCSDHDYHETDSGVFRGIDTIREIRKKMQYKPTSGACSIWLLDELHQMGVGGSSMKNPAQNALLKMLEDTPDHVYFIGCTTNPEMLIKPIRGRCAVFEVLPLEDDVMYKLLSRTCKREKREVPKEVLNQIVKDSGGQSRNALQVLDQIIYLEESEMLEAAKRKAVIEAKAFDLCLKLIKGSSWDDIRKILEGLKDQDPEGIRRLVLKFSQSAMLKGSNQKAYQMFDWFETPTYDTGFPGVVASCYGIVHEKEDD